MIDTGAIVVTVRTHRDGGMPTTQIVNDRPSGLIANLLAKGVTDIRRTVSVLYGLCPIAHLSALDMAARAARGESEAARRSADHALFERGVALEALLENLRVFLTDGPTLLGGSPVTETLRTLGRLRAQLMMVASLLVASPDVETTIAKAHQVITQTARDAASLLETSLLGVSPAAFYAMDSEEVFTGWLTHTQTGTAALMRHLQSLPLGFGQVRTAHIPSLSGIGARALADELYQRLRFEPHFDMMPVLDDRPQLTGAIVRQSAHPMLQATLEAMDVVPLTLTLARLLDTADLVQGLIASDPQSAEVGTPDTARLPKLLSFSFPHQGGVGLVETARGLLTHARGWQPASDDAPQPFYAVTSPTEWQFAPGGPATDAVQNAFRALHHSKALPTTSAAIAHTVRLALFGLDPCVPIRLSVNGVEQALR